MVTEEIFNVVVVKDEEGHAKRLETAFALACDISSILSNLDQYKTLDGPGYDQWVPGKIKKSKETLRKTVCMLKNLDFLKPDAPMPDEAGYHSGNGHVYVEKYKTEIQKKLDRERDIRRAMKILVGEVGEAEIIVRRK